LLRFGLEYSSHYLFRLVTFSTKTEVYYVASFECVTLTTEIILVTHLHILVTIIMGGAERSWVAMVQCLCNVGRRLPVISDTRLSD